MVPRTVRPSDRQTLREGVGVGRLAVCGKDRLLPREPSYLQNQRSSTPLMYKYMIIFAIIPTFWFPYNLFMVGSIDLKMKMYVHIRTIINDHPAERCRRYDY